MKKRLLATLLTLCLIAGLLPISVLAAGSPGASAYNPLEVPAEAFAFNNGTIGSDTSVGGIRTEWLNTQKENLGLTSDDTSIWLEIVIPAEIDGINVTKINRRAFEGKRPYQIASIDFSSATNLKQIGDQAFYLRSEMSGSLDLSKTTNLRIDGPYAFSGTGITELILPSSLSSVGDSAFSSNRSLSSVVIPEGITTLGKSMFLGCTSLKSVTLPNSLQTLGEQAFQSSGLTSIALPDGITVIPKAAFRFCSSLERITFSDNVTVIWNAAFENCTSLSVFKPKTDSGNSPVVLPSKLEKLGRQTFSGAFAEDMRIVVPKTVTFMGTEVMQSAHITQVVINYDTAPAEEMFLTETQANNMSDAGYTNAVGFSAAAFRPETPLGKRAIIFPNKDVYDAFYSKANFGNQNRDNTYTYPITVNFYNGETPEGTAYHTEEKLYKQSIRYAKQGALWNYDENYMLPEVPGGAGSKPGYTDSVWMMNGKELTVNSVVISDTVTLTGGDLVEPEVTFTVKHNPRAGSSWTETVANGATVTVNLAEDQSVDIVPNIQHELSGNKTGDIFFWYRWQDSTAVRNSDGKDFEFGERINTLRIDALDEARTSDDNQYYYIDIEGKTVSSSWGPSYNFDGTPIYTSDDHTYHIHINVVQMENLAYVAASDYDYFIEYDPEKYAMHSVYPTEEALIEDYLIGVFGNETYLESDNWAGEWLPISWQLKPGTKYSSLPEAENTFVWTVSQAEFETLGWTNTNNIPLTGELILKNPKAPDPGSVTLIYYPNGGSGSANVYTYTKGTSTTALGNMFSRDYYVFTGWNTAANGSGTAYAPGAAITLNGNMELYAQWRYVGGSSESGSSDSNDYTLHYVTNGGEHLSDETKSSKWTKDYEDLPTPEREGYTFAGWYWDLRLTEPVTGDVKVDKTTVTLYAKWTGEKATPDETGVSRWLETEEHNAYLSGYPDGTFGPDKNMTRAEVAQMFYALLKDKNVTVTASFSDVPADAWYAKAVNTLASLGMLGGYPDGTFRPDAPITRAEFAAIALAFAYDSANASCAYTDVSAGAWYYTYVAQATTYGWIGGYPGGTFRPNNSITRAEVCVIVNNMLGRGADERYVDRNGDELVSFSDLNDNHWAYYTIMEATNTHDHTKDGSGEVWETIA